MINPTGKKLEKVVFKLFDEAIKGVDRYNYNGSLWLIFTDVMKWVVEYTKDQALWYNYNFFKNEMELIGLDCVENKDLIQKWFESRFLKPKVKDTIQNGVKHTSYPKYNLDHLVEDTIQNGVKHTDMAHHTYDLCVEDTIQNGVKNTDSCGQILLYRVEDIIQNGVKEIYYDCTNNIGRVKGIIMLGEK